MFMDLVLGPGNALYVFDNTQTLTVFAPVNDAFTSMPQGLLSRLEQPVWHPHLMSLIFHHVAVGSVKSSNFSSTHPVSLPMASGFNTTVQIDPAGKLQIDNATAVITDLLTING